MGYTLSDILNYRRGGGRQTGAQDQQARHDDTVGSRKLVAKRREPSRRPSRATRTTTRPGVEPSQAIIVRPGERADRDEDEDERQRMPG